ncbi:FadR/GntR family transcriptional regulator [Maritalea sp.]|uniref:FadR/GntR family transcriptional regulator n=1 Tax=Maritalea sp. TaxID=2003361 RepID=UPI003EF1F6BF
MGFRDTIFKPVDHSSIVDAVVDQIEALILNGVLRDGYKLPSERDLAEQMSASRPKVREALKLLEENDLIISRHGEGTFVAPLIGSAMSPALIDLYSRHASAFLDYLEFRREQEQFASALAAERATDIDKETLNAIMEELEAAHECDNFDASEEADIRFHAAIVDASHNSLLVHTMSSIYALTRQNLFYNRRVLRVADGGAANELLLLQHRAIHQAIIQGKPESARKAARAHIDFLERSYLLEQDRNRREQIANHRRLISRGKQT